MIYSIEVILLASFWAYCRRHAQAHDLSRKPYMWLVAFVWGAGLFGLAIYDHYRRQGVAK